LANPLLYSKPKDMLKGFKFGTGSKRKASRIAAIVLTLAGGLNPAKLHAEDRHTATARLQIQFNVVPSVIAAQPSLQSTAQPSQSPISFNLNTDTQQAGNYSTQKIVVTSQHGAQETAVLKTLTLVND
jgi:hypothetical protein